MEHLEDNFHQNEQYRNTRAEGVKQMQKLYKTAWMNNDVEGMKALIFKGSPIVTSGRNLHLACNFFSANIAIAQLLIDCGVNLDKKNKNGETALHCNVQHRISPGEVAFDTLKLLLKSGANRELRNKEGLTPMEKSLLSGQLDVVVEFLKEEDKLVNLLEVNRTKRRRHLIKCLLQERSNWNIPSTNYSILLQFLVLENDEEMFEYYVNKTKFNVNAINLVDDQTLLHLVVKEGTPRMIKALINVGADLDIDHEVLGTPLTYALKYNRKENANCLLDCGASINKFISYDLETEYPIHYAVFSKNLETLEKLVKMGADVNVLTNHRSPLLLACGSIYSTKWTQTRTLRLLSDYFNDEGNCFLNAKYCSFDVKIVEFLLDHGADLEAKNVLHRTALDQACKLGLLEIVKLLLSRGAKINQEYVSTLHHAVRGENPAIVKLILEKGANVNYRCAPDKMLVHYPTYVYPPPRTPLECALHFIPEDANCNDIIKLLIEYGVNFNVEDTIKSESPLHLAYLSNKGNNFIIRHAESRPTTIKFLLGHNVNVNALDSDGFTPLHYALRNYNLIINENTTENFSNRFKPDLVALIAIIAKMIATKEYVIEQNLILLEKEPAHSIYEECVKEISLMKNNICESRNISFLNILSKDISRWVCALKNKDILQVLDSGNYKKNFPIYSEFLEHRILESSIRQPLVESAIVLFKKHVNEYMLPELLFNMFTFLNLVDLKNFAKACFAEVE